MTRFNVCARRVTGGDSYSFMAFHRCVEAVSRLTGEPFNEIFSRLGRKHGFRREPGRWPKASQLLAAQAELAAEREAYLAALQAGVARRRAEKRAGRRHKRDEPLDQMEAQRRSLVTPRVGYWGWRERRNERGR